MRGAFRSGRNSKPRLPKIGDPRESVNSRLPVLAHVFHLRPADVWGLTVREFFIFAKASDDWIDAQSQKD